MWLLHTAEYHAGAARFATLATVPVLAHLPLARLLELSETRLAWRSVDMMQEIAPEAGSARLFLAGGVAAYCGAGSPLTHAIGLGMRGAVPAQELDQLEEFYFSRGSFTNVDVSPFAHVSLPEQLGQRGFRPVEWNQVLIRPVQPEDARLPSSPDMAVHTQAQESEWAHTVMRGFMERDNLLPDEVTLSRVLYRLSNPAFLLQRGEQAIAAAGYTVYGTLAAFFADSTLVTARRRGAHSALIAARLRAAARAGCTLATVTTLPGSGSQRDYERAGFRVLYTKLAFQKECPAV